MSRVSQAIKACQRDYLHSAEAVIQRTRSLAAIEAAKSDLTGTSVEETTLPRVDVPLPDLSLLQPTSQPSRRRKPRDCLLCLIRFPEPRF